jgi:hypothetical protein
MIALHSGRVAEPEADQHSAPDAITIQEAALPFAHHRKHRFSDLFVAYLPARNIRYEEDLVDQLFNSSEKRLARLWSVKARQ